MKQDNEMLNKAIQTVANKTIPKGSRINPKPWWDKDLDAKIQMCERKVDMKTGKTIS